MSAIAAALQGLQILRTIGAVKSNVDSLAKVADVQAALLDVQGQMFALRGQVDALQRENDELRRQASERSRYELMRTRGGAIVYRSKAGVEPEHYACPRCMHDGRLHLLQSCGPYSGSYQCDACRQSWQIEEDPPLPQGRGLPDF